MRLWKPPKGVDLGAESGRAALAKARGVTKLEPLPADPWEFMRRCVYTYDERAVEHGLATVRRFPDKDYLRILTREWQAHKNIEVDKSSQILVTWLFAGLYLHLALSQRAVKVAWFCLKKHTASEHLRDRLYRIWLTIPPKFQKPHVEVTEDGLMVYHDGPDALATSQIVPMAMESDSPEKAAQQMRSMTWTKVMVDESAFSRKAREIYVSTMPRTGGITGVSTANGNSYHYKLGYAKDPDSAKTEIVSPAREALARGMTAWQANKFRYVEVNYRADPDKDPEMPAGAVWYAAERAKMPSDRAWRREYENDHSVAAGLPVYDETEKIILKPQSYRPWLPLLRWWDFGFANPFCCLAQIEEPSEKNALTELRLHLLAEIRMSNITLEAFASHYVIPTTERLCPGAKCRDCGDPAARQKSDKSALTSEDVLKALGIRLISKPSKIEEGADLFQLLISKGCVEMDPVLCARLKAEIFGTYYRDEDGVPVKDGVNDHGPDGVRYGVLNCVRYAKAGSGRFFGLRYETGATAWTPEPAAPRR